ncbi:MAG: glycoside hydrolase family 2, partial [bacterium]|nr:glycoside hydrolase family 2 [bacterium]
MHAGLLALLLPVVALSAAAAPAAASATETLRLSGTGYQETVDWEFFCTEGRRCGEWTTIPVPSQWELEGFGRYNYGHDEDKSREQGRYRHRFRVPASWRGKTVDLTFEGVMTDAEVWLNGEPAGPKHQGGFYRFRYDVTELLRFDAENLLEVTVSKHSSDESVNRAEREADYWVFGGIFRPVTLEAMPPEAIGHLAIDARHDGSFLLRATLRGMSARGRLEAQIRTAEGEAVGASFAAEVAAGESAVLLE